MAAKTCRGLPGRKQISAVYYAELKREAYIYSVCWSCRAIDGFRHGNAYNSERFSAFASRIFEHLVIDLLGVEVVK